MGLKLSEETDYRILRLIEENPSISQRDLARKLGVSLGKANFCLRALVDKGVLKARSFCNSSNKRAYMYLLTPKGIRQKARITINFLRSKVAEYEALRAEIAELQEQLNPHEKEVGQNTAKARHT